MQWRSFNVFVLTFFMAHASWQLNWEAMVINLDKRVDRLQRFASAMKESEPWLYNSGRLCRVHGRDGAPLLSSERAQRSQRRAKHAFLGTVPDVRTVPFDLAALTDEELAEGGWVQDSVLIKLRQRDVGWPTLTAGGLGLYLGHAAAWRYIVSRNLDFGLIFEDDLTLYSPTFKQEVQNILNGRQTSEWDWLYLQLDTPAWPKDTAYPFSGNRSSNEDSITGLVPNTGAYILTQKGARKLLKSAFPAVTQLDDQLTKLADQGLKRRVLNPTVAQCNEGVLTKFGFAKDTDVQNGGVTSESFRSLQESIKDLSETLEDVAGISSHKDVPVDFSVPDCKE